MQSIQKLTCIDMYVCNNSDSDSDKTVAFELAAFSFFFFCLFWNLIASGLLFSKLALPGSNSQINHKLNNSVRAIVLRSC